MNTHFYKLVLKGLWKRRAVVLKTSLAVFVAYLFVAGILLFQENMYQYQTALSKKHFGDWFVMDKDYKEDEQFVNSFLKEAHTATNVNHIYNYSEKTSLKIGYFSQGFIDKGNIRLDQGRWPEADDEIAIEWNTLLKLNQGFNLGDEITIHTFIGNPNPLDDKNEVTEKYRLVGIINSYTNVWNSGDSLPGIIMTKNEADRLAYKPNKIAIYGLNPVIKENDYLPVFERLKKENPDFEFNSAVYENKPWGNEFIYNYMFILIMVIGISGITYQMMIYNLTRKESRRIHVLEGATKMQLIQMFVIENTIILIVSSLIGFVISIGVAKIICLQIERHIGVSFFYMGRATVIKMIITLVLSVFVSSTFNILVKGEKKERKHAGRGSDKGRNNKAFNEKNFELVAHARLMRTNGFWPNCFVRIFALVMTIVIMVCGVNICTAYDAIKKIADTDDFVGFLTEDTATSYVVNYIVGEDYQNAAKENSAAFEQMSEIQRYNSYRKDVASYEEFKKISTESGKLNEPLMYIKHFSLNKRIKCGDSIIFKGFGQDVTDAISKVEGVENVKYGYFETGRTFVWTDIDFNQMNAEKYEGVHAYKAQMYEDKKYLFATEYAKADKELYDLLCKYIDGDKPDFEVFKKGEAVIIFEEPDDRGQYDNSLEAGKTLYMNYLETFLGNNAEYVLDGSKNSYSDAVIQYYVKNICGADESSVQAMINNKSWSFGIQKDYYKYALSLEKLEQLYVDSYNNLEAYNRYKKRYEDGLMSEEEFRDFLSTNAYLEFERQCQYDFKFNQVSTGVGAVIRITDENREAILKDFREYIPEFAQYTAVASEELLQKLIDRQNEWLKNYLVLDELPDEIKLEKKYNQVNIRYGINSALVSTGNIVASLLGQAGCSYSTYSEEKEQQKTKIMDAFLLYGFTLIAALAVVLIVMAIIEKNRLEKYESRLKILKHNGADNWKLEKICLIECIREALWCPFLMIFIIVADCLVIRRFIIKLK